MYTPSVIANSFEMMLRYIILIMYTYFEIFCGFVVDIPISFRVWYDEDMTIYLIYMPGFT